MSGVGGGLVHVGSSEVQGEEGQCAWMFYGFERKRGWAFNASFSSS